ncbi:MAG: AmmeMemoRadiSam system protein B [Chloroflexi bacterium]|nr:AmmeMemoRadiSam system protein B [Chloroflexota bacterium]
MILQTQDVRPSPLAGRWYPASARKLEARISTMLKAAEIVDLPGAIQGLLAPHAGHTYSGPVAAHAFRQVQGREVKRVIVIGPMHHIYPETTLTSDHSFYETPLGQIAVDQDLLRVLGQKLPLKRIRRDPEHSVEIELPFLQVALAADFKLVPLMMRDQSFETSQALGEALAELASPDDLLVASSDLSHFYPQHVAKDLDQAMLRRVASFDPDSVIQAERDGIGFACGRGAIVAVMVAAQRWGADKATILNYATSGDINGDLDKVVGYGAASFTGPQL